MKTVLIIDPEFSGSSLPSVLDRSGLRSFVVSEANTALTIVRSGMPVDLVIMELQLPDMDGLDLLTMLRRMSPGLPVLVVTSRGSIESYLQAINLGVIEYLNKPVLSKELSCIVRSALDGPGGVKSISAA
ncbi:MAG: response regulator [Nitrospirota bacterium]|nr:response regulator [Nitrospirota bacterium]